MEWNEVKEKPKKKPQQHHEAADKPQYGGKGAKGKLIAGPIQNGQMHAESGAIFSHDGVLNNQASHLA